KKGASDLTSSVGTRSLPPRKCKRHPMVTFTRRIGMATLCGVVMLSMNPRAHGQSPIFQVRPGLTLQQYAFNLQTIGRAVSTVPPYALRSEERRVGK